MSAHEPMQPGEISFHRPLAFWFGCILLTIGVLSHAPMFLMGAHTHYHLAGMPMDTGMLVGMALIPLGLCLSGYGLLPRIGNLRLTPQRTVGECHFHLADGVALNRRHWTLVLVLVVALAVDVMKPATLGFVMPGMTREYAISRETGALLALVALTGTTLGSILWGHLGDLFGRRSAILLSALMFIGTAICGAMPTFGWNLAMCFLMGASAGGLLPIAFTLMAETVPAAHRGWLLVALGGLGTSAGYLLAASAATWLEPLFSWRALWLLGLPTGALIILLNRWIPESPRFLSSVGLRDAAQQVLLRFSGNAQGAIEADDADHPGPPIVEEQHPIASMRQLMRGRHAMLTLGLVVCGIAWGLTNFGFLLWLPSNLVSLGIDPAGSSALLARSAVIALPGIALVVWLYQRWSSVRSLVLFIALSVAALAAFMLMALLERSSAEMTTAATVALLVSTSGVIAMLIPYAAEIYPVHLRGSGSGVIAASSKFGGILGAGLGTLGFFENLAMSAALIALPMVAAALLLARTGVETRGLRLEEIQSALGKPATGG
ncbi:MFS transporter [Dokdonella immobilis]|uniref:MFS transporter, putative metabolite:H+ symporter n=1 Tax=Dokdonella immobilis TaxID=578942 RepID=A0A1I4XU49_9GAMM|nr:MFS transporter [Dokdonella immobilis]SFN29395.1 MFS transporter, putative metabolite:H+ symporter [Dokdonella immobilis]